MGDAITIRAATAADIGVVLQLWGAARSAAASTADTPEAVARLLEHQPGALIVAFDGGRLVGTLIAAFDGWRGGMYRLAVLPDHRRRGIATTLVEAGHAHLRGLGATRVTALVGADEDVALALWRAVGYRHDVEIARLSRNL
jgi:ribosomal protein S18 acetylase RimI-like enzyme